MCSTNNSEREGGREGGGERRGGREGGANMKTEGKPEMFSSLLF